MRKIDSIKIVLLIFIFCINTFSSSAQTRKSEYEIYDSLRNQTQKVLIAISKCDDTIKSPYYISLSFDNYQNRLENTLKLLDNLYLIENEFVKLTSVNQTEIAYFSSLAYIDLSFLNVYGNSDSYIGFFKISDKDRYDLLKNKWDGLKNKHLVSLESRLEKITILDSSSIDIKVIKAITLFYRGSVDDAVKNIKGLIYSLENKKPQLNENDTKRDFAYISYLYSWLTYFNITSRSADNARENLNNSRKYCQNEELSTNYWLNNTEKKLLFSINNYSQLNLESFKGYDNNKIPIIVKKINWLEENSKLRSLDFKSVEIFTSLNPSVLSNLTNTSWEALVDEENNPWIYVDQAFKIEGEKDIYKKGYIFFETINLKNKGVSNANLILHLEQIGKLNQIYNDLTCVVAGWSELIENNPDVYYYYLMRIKANLGLFYISKVVDDYYLNTLNYLKIDGDNVKNYLKSDIKKYFMVNNQLSLESDIAKIQAISNDLMTKITNAEFIFLVRDTEYALKQNEALKKEIDKKSKLIDVNAMALIEIYNSCIFLERHDIVNLEKSISELKKYDDAKEWLDILTTRMSVLTKEYDFYNKEKK